MYLWFWGWTVPLIQKWYSYMICGPVFVPFSDREVYRCYMEGMFLQYVFEMRFWMLRWSISMRLWILSLTTFSCFIEFRIQQYIFLFFYFGICAHRLLDNYSTYLGVFYHLDIEIEQPEIRLTSLLTCTLIPICVFYVFSFIITGHIATAGQFKEHLIYFTPREK